MQIGNRFVVRFERLPRRPLYRALFCRRLNWGCHGDAPFVSKLAYASQFIVPARATRGKVLLISGCDRHTQKTTLVRRQGAKRLLPEIDVIMRRIWSTCRPRLSRNKEDTVVCRGLLQRLVSTPPQEEHVLKFLGSLPGGSSRFRRDFLIPSGAGRVKCPILEPGTTRLIYQMFTTD